MAGESNKRYVVTFKDSNVSYNDVANLLHRPTEQVRDGVQTLISERPVQDKDILHFAPLGESAATLTKREVEELRQNDAVLEVVEDFDVHALGVEDNDDEETSTFTRNRSRAFPATGRPDRLLDEQLELNQRQAHELPVGDDYSRALSDELERYQAEAFDQGYNQALTDIFQQLLRRRSGSSDDMRGTLLRPELGPILRPKLPDLPILLPKQPIPWNIKLVRADKAWARATGLGVKVAVLDTGIASHPDLVISGGASMIPGVVSFNDGHGHGTHCAGVIGARNNFLGVVGVAPDCKLYGVKVLADSGSGQLSWVLAGMAWALQNKMQVVSMSLGSKQPPVLAYQNAAAALLNAGCVVVAAAGNSFADPSFPWVNAPANSPAFMAIGAVDQNKLIAPFSSRGGAWNQVTLVAPGVSVNSTYLNNGYKSMSGTSMACPHVAGAAALVRQRYPVYSAVQIRNRIAGTASDLGFPGTDATYGRGLLNCEGSVA